MQSYVASACLAAAFVLMPAAAGRAPARSQDFSITNTVEPADAGRRNLMRQLQAWWDVHAYYPKAAAQNDEGGTVKLHLQIHPDGNIWMVDVAAGSGSAPLDKAGTLAFKGGFVRPFPNPTAPDAALDVSVHYVLAHRHDQPVAANDIPVASNAPFTITNDPVRSGAVDTMLRRTCTGIVVKDGWRNHPIYGWRSAATAIFFRKPDGTPWVKFTVIGSFAVAPVTESGKLAQWTVGPEIIRNGFMRYTRYAVWPDGDNHLSGDVSDPQGTIDLTCTAETVPMVTSNGLTESSPPPAPAQADARE